MLLVASKHQQNIATVPGKMDDDNVINIPEHGQSTIAQQQQQQQLQPQPQHQLQSHQRHQRPKVSKQSSVEVELISLQKQTLAEVKRLADLQAMQLEVAEARLAVDKELLLLKKAKMMASGTARLDEHGCWVLTVHENKEE